jgi:hypothetical protein
MKARSRAASSSTSRSTTSTSRPIRSLRGAGAWIDRVGVAALFPGSDLVLPSLWEAVAGARDVEWAVRDEQTGKYVSFTPEMERCWRWKDELPERGLACVGKHFGRWAAIVAPRLVPHAVAVAAGRREQLTPFQRDVVDAVREAGPAIGPELRRLLRAEKKEVDAAVVALQRALVLTASGLVEQEQGWGAVAVDLVERRWRLGRLPSAATARCELARTVLRSAGELSAADLGGALGWRVRVAREVLDELAHAGEAQVRVEADVALYT